MQQTTNYNLNKPDPSDFAKIESLNENADIIDALIKEHLDETAEWQKFKLTDDNGIVKYLTSGQYASVKDVPPGRYYITGAISNELSDLPLQGLGGFLDVTEAQANVKLIDFTVNNAARYAVYRGRFDANGISDKWKSIVDTDMLGTAINDALSKFDPKTTFNGNLNSVIVKCSIYAAGEATNKPTDASFYVDVLPAPSSGDATYVKQVARRATGATVTQSNETYEREMVEGVWRPWVLKLNALDVINDLTSTATNKPISAAAVKGLKDSLKTAAYQEYEEGTWTPSLIGSTGGSATLDIASGQYRRIGKLVTATFIIQKSTAHTLTGDVRIGGLPFASNASGGSMSVAFRRGITSNGELLGETSNSNYVSFAKCLDDGTFTLLQSSEVGVGMRIRAIITYLID